MKHAQTWSMDVLMAVGLFIVGFMMLYYFVGLRAESTTSSQIADEGERLPRLFSGSQNESYVFIEGNQVDRTKLENLTGVPYEQLKGQLGLRADFCLYLEDEDGNIINLSGSRVGVGSNRSSISGISCG